MADNIKYRFIQNVGDYFPSGYFGEDFLDKVQKCAGISNDEVKELCSPYVRLQHDYDEYKNFIINHNPRTEDAIKKTHDFNTLLLKILGYETDHAYQEHCVTNEDSDPIEMIPVRHILRQGQQVKMFVMEMQNLIAINDQEPAGLFEQQYESEPDRNTKQQKYSARQWRFVFELPEGYKISPAIINKAITQIFLLPEERRPHFILMMAGNVVFLFDKDKWAKGSYLQFSLDELFAQARVPAFKNYYALFHMLVSKQTLAAEGEMVLMDTIIEESYKNAYEVTKDLKEGVILAVETLANEALYYMKNVVNRPFGKYNKESDTYDETDDDFEAEVKDDCLTIIYRLLFLFYAESREELEILPVGDEVYKRGYSLESLRDLEMVRLNSQESRDGYFFDDSIRHLFNLLSDGHNATLSGYYKSFRVRPIDSPLFNNKNLKHLADVRIRNIKWQEIIKALSLSKKKNYCGRISYANLGVNQLGSVYESLLAFRGFYAEEDYIEVHKANDPSDGTFLVPYSRMGDFDISEVLCNQETGEPIILPKGTFVYRLNGRDRQKSASYYTPEVLTRSTVKYTLKAIIDDVASNKRKATELLDLKILEPAMGAAAFQNEVINQLAEAYLTHQQRQQRERGIKNWRIQPDKYRDELQRVKAFIATHNVYGVDLNPTAIELGKLSLWLNVINKNTETPFFANRLVVGNAVIGAWLKVYSKEDVKGITERQGRTLKLNKWWEKAPHKIKFYSNRVNRSVNDVYHFLLPDANMLGVRNIRDQKQAHPNEYARMTLILKDWTAPITEYDFQTLQRLSGKIDILLKEYYTDQISIDKYTYNRKDVWDGIDHTDTESMFKEEEQAESYARKQQLFDTRYRRDNAYRKLKLAMDYWCALWFWEYDNASDLPTREEYWADIEALLDVDNDKLDTRTRQALERYGSLFAAEDGNENGGRMTEEESEIVTKTQEELLTSSHGSTTLFAHEDSLRLKIADRLAKRYRFFHPMLEFIEVFWLRDGFDIICGNPPWVKVTFKASNIISEQFPEVSIRKTSAPEMKEKMQQYMNNTRLKQTYVEEETAIECTDIFVSSKSTYPLVCSLESNLYKCILENSFELISDEGVIGMLHPESVFTENNGQLLRQHIYHRLKYRFQYHNKFSIFEGPGADLIFGENIYGRYKDNISFDSISYLFNPNTIDGSLVHTGEGECYGLKVEDRWNTRPHKYRIVPYTYDNLKIVADTFEDSCNPEEVKFVSIFDRRIVDILKPISKLPKRVSGYNFAFYSGLHQTGEVVKGTMRRDVKYADVNDYGIIYCGPQISVANPLAQTPRENCQSKFDYDTLLLTEIGDSYMPRTIYTRAIDKEDFIQKVKAFSYPDGSCDYWIDYYKIAIREFINNTSDRSLASVILPPKVSHLYTLISVIFENEKDGLEFASLTSSLVMDFFLKTIGAQHLNRTRLENFPMGIKDKYKNALFVRLLLLNCLNVYYKDLWERTFSEDFLIEKWSHNDERLKDFSSLSNIWSNEIPLRTFYERRMALVEIDVISAISFGLTIDELEYIYNVQFPILKYNEEHTWYDQKGNIVYSNNKNYSDVGVDIDVWDKIRNMQKGESYLHTIEKSQIYNGKQITYYAPFTRCDRIADYRTAWAHFEKIFGDK